MLWIVQNGWEGSEPRFDAGFQPPPRGDPHRFRIGTKRARSPEHRYPLLWVAGEISNCVRAKSGHLYFSLKDEMAQVRCVMFRNRGQYLDWEPRDASR